MLPSKFPNGYLLSLIGLSLALLLGACGEINRPYKTRSAPDKLNNSLLQLPDARGLEIIYVSPDLSGEALQFYDLLEAQLGAYHIPVSKTAAHDHGHQLIGEYTQTQNQISYIWDISDQSFGDISSQTSSQKLNVRSSLEASQKRLAQNIALEIARLIKPDVVEALHKEINFSDIKINVGEILNMPGDGEKALRRNLSSLLKKASINEISEAQSALITIRGTGQVSSLNEAEDEVQLDWSFYDSNGVELRSIQQKNTIVKGALDKRWGNVAYYVAAGVMQEMAKTIDDLLLQQAIEENLEETN